ncbi:hypothetical protein ABZ915_31950 [Streptomyces sp. NPDC046915]|uniref:aromatic-ring hydroxylase C-terminal domain-containing protein n=1 Tax=Streptomyces sp. NPDC046915 TaxID=3155257 RepID=UPI0033C493CF
MANSVSRQAPRQAPHGRRTGAALRRHPLQRVERGLQPHPVALGHLVRRVAPEQAARRGDVHRPVRGDGQRRDQLRAGDARSREGTGERRLQLLDPLPGAGPQAGRADDDPPEGREVVVLPVRPDGFVAWAADRKDSAEDSAGAGLSEALERWFGAAAPDA